MLVIDYTIMGSGHVLSHSYDGCPALRGSGWNRLRDVVDKTQMNPIQISNSKWMDTWTFGFNWYTSHIYQAEKASHPVQKSSYMGGHFKLNSIIAIECLFEYITVDISERKKSDKPQFMTKRQIHIPRNVVIVGTICMQLPRQRWAAMAILVTVTNGEHIFVQQNYHWAGVSVIYSTTLNFERGNE